MHVPFKIVIMLCFYIVCYVIKNKYITILFQCVTQLFNNIRTTNPVDRPLKSCNACHRGIITNNLGVNLVTITSGSMSTGRLPGNDGSLRLQGTATQNHHSRG